MKKRITSAPLEPISEEMDDNIPLAHYTVYTFLNSTPYTATAPFRHGPILHRIPGRELDTKTDLDCPEYLTAVSIAAHHWLSDNYESQQEEKFDEVGDLIEWWKTWGFEGTGELITEENDREWEYEVPYGSISNVSLDLPDVSYSDTTSEDSVGSSHGWSQYSDEHGYLSNNTSEYGFRNLEHSFAGESYEDVGKKSDDTIVSELAVGGNLTEGLVEPYQ